VRHSLLPPPSLINTSPPLTQTFLSLPDPHTLLSLPDPHTLLSLPDPHAIPSHKQFMRAILEYGGRSKRTTELFEESTPLGITKKFFTGMKVQ